MKKHFKLTALTLALLAASTVAASAADPYKVRVPLSEDENGAMIYILNFDSGEKIDSTIVADKVALFKGEIDEPVVGRLMLDGQRAGDFILEPGSIVVDPRMGMTFGSMLNDRLRELNDSAQAISKRFAAAVTDQEKEKIYNEYMAYSNAVMNENLDNPIGYYLFVNQASSMSPEEFNRFITEHPSLASYKRIAKIKESHSRKLATAPGNKFTDFEITYNGETKRLNDYVGKGKYVLVDYWASWCGPCIRQVPVLKELLHEYGDKGLEVLGVAVWDEPANTYKAIESHQIPWPCIVNAQTIPTDLYGINGIPCIILYGPDGTILSRDKQGDELKADVKAAFEGTLKY